MRQDPESEMANRHGDWLQQLHCTLDRRRFDKTSQSVRFQKWLRPVSLEIPKPDATVYQNLMRQNPDLTRSGATSSTLRPKCPQSHRKKSKQGSAFVEFTEIPFCRNYEPFSECHSAGLLPSGRQPRSRATARYPRIAPARTGFIHELEPLHMTSGSFTSW
jgi:hypothetical protein